MIRIRNLNKFYNKGRQNQVHAINNTTLDLPDSGMIAFFGKSGCGKTTLLNVIGGLDGMQSGSVSIDGEEITPTSNDARNKKVGYIFQNYNLSKQMTVYENVASSLRLCGVENEQEIESRVMAALRSVEMDKYRKRFPDELSGGQQQRVAIARAIVKNPDVILADEPTGNLDEQNTVLVMDLLKEISKEHLVLLVTHEQKLVDLYCDEVIEIVDGVVGERYQNSETGGYLGKKAGDVYLGDMERTQADGEHVSVECFGEFSTEKVALRLISVGGVLYLSAPEGVRIKFADSSSEIKIHEGCFEERVIESHNVIDDALKAPVRFGKCGRIYNFKSALKSAYISSLGRKKKGRKMLVAALLCFSMVIVLMVSLFGTVFYASKEISTQYNTNTVFVSADAAGYDDIQGLISSGKADNALAVNVYYNEYYNSFNNDYISSYTFGNGHFETIQNTLGIDVNARILPESSIGDRKAVIGKASKLGAGEAVISRVLAERMLEKSSYISVNSFDDLIGLNGETYMWYSRDTELSIVGIVEGDDYAIYTNDTEYAKTMLAARWQIERSMIRTPSDMEYNVDINNGEVYLEVDSMSQDSPLPQIGEVVLLDGMQFKVAGYKVLGGTGISKYTSSKEYAEGEIIVDSEIVTDEYYDSYYSYVSAFIFTESDMLELTMLYGKTSDMFDSYIYESGYGDMYYAVHTQDIDRFVDELEGKYGSSALITPQSIYEDLSGDYQSTFVGLGVALVVVLVVMSLCLFLIMRSSIMADVKQIGVYRAIGVSKKNIVFRYLVESCLVFSLTVFVGYLISSIGISRMISLAGNMMEGMLYYPLWLAVITFVCLLGVSVVCGLIPVCTLLRRTPAEILSKYDI